MSVGIAILNYVLYADMLPDFSQRVIMLSWVLLGYVAVCCRLHQDVLDVFIIETLCMMRRGLGLCPRTRCSFGGAQALLLSSGDETANLPHYVR